MVLVVGCDCTYFVHLLFCPAVFGLSEKWREEWDEEIVDMGLDGIALRDGMRVKGEVWVDG